MLLEMSALTWLNQLYAADLDSLTYGEHQSDVPAIVEEVMIFNAPFQANPKRDDVRKGDHKPEEAG